MEINLPLEFKNRMKELLGDEYEDFLKSYEKSSFHGLRINTLKADCRSEENDKKIDFLKASFNLSQIPWCKTGYYYNEEQKPGRDVLHHAGVYYIQEPSAMLVGELAAPAEGMKVLDLCAAPGGKTGHLAGYMRGKGVLVANEIVPSRCKILSQNVERLGIANCIVINENPINLAKKLPSYFDMVVVDVPCSGEGMFRKDGTAINEWSVENVEMCGARGQEILEAADSLLEYGGKLVYSTCTFSPIEDEAAILNFMAKHPLYKIEKIELLPNPNANSKNGWLSEGVPKWGQNNISDEINSLVKDRVNDLKYTYRLWPHRLNGEGHYAAVLRKGDFVEKQIKSTLCGAQTKNNNGKGNRELETAIKLYKEFEDKNLRVKYDGNFVMFGSNLYLLPLGAPDIRGIKVERAGLLLGEIKKDRFEPSHSLAMSLKADECKNIYETDEALKYLCGEVIGGEVAISGWCCITFKGYPLGWGKAAGGRIKNHYPKGLRIKM